jgi:hypothetical protein
MRDLSPFNSRVVRYLSSAATARAVVAGLIGGLVGTIVMDLFGFGISLSMEGPANLSFSIIGDAAVFISFTVIGDAAAAFLSKIGIQVAGGAPLGAVLHYLIGFVFGAILGVLVSHVDSLRLDSVKKGIVVGILFVEAMSVTWLVPAAIVLKMTVSETAQYFGVSSVMHLVYGSVLGVIMYYRLRPKTTPDEQASHAGQHGL